MHIRFNLSKKILGMIITDAIYHGVLANIQKNKLYYRVLSEFMLQQTQVKTVILILKNLQKFKTLKDFI